MFENVMPIQLPYIHLFSHKFICYLRGIFYCLFGSFLSTGGEAEGSDSDEEVLNEKDNELVTQGSASFIPVAQKSTSDVAERTHKVDFSWISKFIASKYSS